MSGSGRSGNNRKNRHRFSKKRDEALKFEKKQSESLSPEVKHDKNRQNERPRWTAPVLPSNPAESHNCPWCGKPITDITAAITDKESGLPVHFDCVIDRITATETLESNDSVCYIGGGRFGILHYNNPPDTRDFVIKKILEWEQKETNTKWRRPFSEYFSVT
jgi:hypothetical protein